MERSAGAFFCIDTLSVAIVTAFAHNQLPITTTEVGRSADFGESAALPSFSAEQLSNLNAFIEKVSAVPIEGVSN